MRALVWDLDGTLTRPGSVVAAPGVDAVLRAWADRGVPLAVATSAGTAAARAVVDALGWADLFDHVAGSAPGVHGKDDVVAEALLGLGLDPTGDAGAGAGAVIGDSTADVHAARHHGLVAVGAAWGGASPEALYGAGAHHVVDDPAALAPGGVLCRDGASGGAVP